MRTIGKLIKFVWVTTGVLVGTLVVIAIAVSVFGDTDSTDSTGDPNPTRASRVVASSTEAPQPSKSQTSASESASRSEPAAKQNVANASVSTCADFDSWMWAQAVYDQSPDSHAALDPDGNGVACDELTVYGFAPVTFAKSIPSDTTKATFLSVTDGDTIKVQLEDGTTDTVRLLHIDTPETTGTVGQCGGDEATNYLNWILSYAGGKTLYLESDVTARDKYDRRLAYVWFSVDNDPNPYMANHAMVMSGWAESESYGPDTKYKTELEEAEKFSVAHVTGVRLLCGKFGLPANDAGPSEEQVRQAWLKQPNQGQLPPFPGTARNTSQPSANPVTANQPQQSDSAAPDTVVDQPAQEAPVVEQPPAEQPVFVQPPPQDPNVEQPPAQDPVVEQPPAQEPVNECDPSYPDFCLAPAYVIGDLDCGDVGYTNFRVFPPDSHGFDGNGDGYGCEGG